MLGKTVLVILLPLLSLSQAKDAALKFDGQPAQNQEKGEIKTNVVLKPNPNDTPKEQWEKPTFCNDLDCPPFKVNVTTDDYQLRDYEGSAWVETSMTGVNYMSASYQMFMRLFRYISGNNAANQKIAMTCPVTVRFIPGQGPACENNFTMAFYVALKDAPAPKESTVRLTSVPKFSVYVKSFGGFATQNKNIKTALALGNKLKEEKKKFRSDIFYSAGYDAPFKLFNRHNEVWLAAEN